MKGFKPSVRPDTFARKVVTFVVLGCFCAATVPLPIAYISILDKDQSQPFPCQNCPCGCKTAEQCWTSCCCFTPSERLAWAEKNGVVPPSYATIALTRAKASNPPKTSSCCSAKKTCCEKHADIRNKQSASNAVGNSACCATKSIAGSVADGDEATSTIATTQKVVVSIFALKCQGRSTQFTLLPWTVLASVQQLVIVATEFGPAYELAIIDPLAVFLKPDTPPPKQMLA